MIVLELITFQNKFKNSECYKNITTDIYRIQAYDSEMCRYFCTWFIDFVMTSKSLLDYIILFSPNKCKENDKIILQYFQQREQIAAQVKLFWLAYINIHIINYFYRFKMEWIVFSRFFIMLWWIDEKIWLWKNMKAIKNSFKKCETIEEKELNNLLKV